MEAIYLSVYIVRFVHDHCCPTQHCSCPSLTIASIEVDTPNISLHVERAAMSNVIPSPDPQVLIPPLLACLPTAFASHKPPPAFVSQLSPILRQRIDLNTSTGSGHDSWLRLLCWDSEKAEELKETIENAHFEPHPSSGELEVGEVERISYKRFDLETLKAQIPLNDWSLTALYLWCTGGEAGDAWKLSELIPFDIDLSRDESWTTDLAEASQNLRAKPPHLAVQQSQQNGRGLSVPGLEDDDDDDYWDRYDKSPGGRTPGLQTPARKPSVNPQGSSTEADYYAQYGDVQPAMDGYDPDENHEEIGESTLNGISMNDSMKQNSHLYQEYKEQQQAPQSGSDRLNVLDAEEGSHINQPVPSSPSSRTGSDTIAKLEETADRYSASEIAIKQHITYSVKSMFRLARGAGLSRQDFEDLVQRELDTLSLLDNED